VNSFLHHVFPTVADSHYPGNPIALWFFMALAIISTVRSLIHIFARDGGAGSIAGLDLSKGDKNIIFSFALWGQSQLIYALLQLLVAFRYQSLVPLFYLILLVELIGRMAVGRMKPPVLLRGRPPGGYANLILLPLSVIMFVLSV
jgi:hypothetical protein